MGALLARLRRVAPATALLIVACWAVAFANDSEIRGAGGRVVPMQGEHRSIRMVRETIRIDVWPRNYEVHARFWFQNDGAATRVKMGFPERGAPYSAKSAMIRFATTVDGRPAEVTRKLTQRGRSYEAYWVKEVAFADHQQRVVDVRYCSPLGTVADFCDADPRNTPTAGYATYDFTGGNWKGLVDESALEVHLHLAGYLLSRATTKSQRQGDVLRWRKSHWQAEGRYYVAFCQTGKDFLCASSGSRDLTEKDLKGRTGRDLTLMRNEIFARYGRLFRDPQVKAWFESRSWYHGDPGYSDEWPNKTEHANAALIQRYQDEHHLTW